MTVPALPQSIGSSGARRPRSPAPVDANDVHVLVVDLDAERAHRRRSPTRCRPARPKPRMTLSPSRDRAEQDGALGDALHARHGDVAADLGGRLDLHSRIGATLDAVALLLEQPGGPLGLALRPR